MFGRAEKMRMITHDDVTANQPAMAFVGGMPFFLEDLGDVAARKNRTSIFGADRHEIDRLLNPDLLQAPKMFVHSSVLMKLTELGDQEICNCGECRSWPRTASAATVIPCKAPPRSFFANASLATPA